jgi:3',5'-cyclic-nucleotide phosphodiesterase
VKARNYETAAQWTLILTDEFSRQASMEQDLGIPSALFAPPVREIIELGKSQLGFMNMFAIPLFQGVTDVMPGMGYCVDELQRNKSAWEARIAEEQAKARHDSEDSAMTDGMFSPRAMSVANPSDASHQKISNATSSPDLDLRKALLSKSPFLNTNGSLDEFFEPHHHSLPALSTTSEPRIESENPSPSETVPDPNSRRSSNKPSQLQLSFATASAPGLVDHPSQDPHLPNGSPHVNGLSVTPSLVTDPVVIDPSTANTDKVEDKEKQRSSDGTEGSVSAQDWTSQATSATTGKMPLSPSTQGTSIMSQESVEKNQTPTRRSPGSASEDSRPDTMTGEESRDKSRDKNLDEGAREEKVEADRVEENGKGMLVERVRNLKKKPSRFRMNFWKRSKSSSPPVPVQRGNEEEERGLSLG